MGRILAIDFGTKRTGIAVTDELRMIANALTTVPTHTLLDFLKDYIQKENVDRFVIGKPLQMNNTDSESVKHINIFLKKLKKAIPGIPVDRVDERFTSLIAEQTIRTAGLKKKDRQNKALVDSVSATIILQSWLEANQ